MNIFEAIKRDSDKKILKHLEKYPKDINLIYKDRTVLDCAIDNLSTRCLEVLINKGSHVICSSSIKSIVENNYKTAVEIILKKMRKTSQAVILNLACKNLRYNHVKFLIDNGFDVNLQDDAGNTPLMTICYYFFERLNDGSFKTILLLIKENNTINLKNNKGETALFSLLSSKFTYYTTACTELGANAIEFIVENLIKNGVDVNAKDNAGRTALFYACVHDIPASIIKKMLECGADPTIKDKDGRTALEYYIFVYENRECGTNKQIITILKNAIIGE